MTRKLLFVIFAAGLSICSGQGVAQDRHRQEGTDRDFACFGDLDCLGGILLSTSREIPCVRQIEPTANHRHGEERYAEQIVGGSEEPQMEYNRQPSTASITIDLLREFQHMYEGGDIDGAAVMAEMAYKLRPEHHGAQLALALIYRTRQARERAAACFGGEEESSVEINSHRSMMPPPPVNEPCGHGRQIPSTNGPTRAPIGW